MAASAIASSTANKGRDMEFQHLNTASDDTATILVEGLERDLKLLHLTDSHMAEGDGRDPEAAEHVERYGELFSELTPGGAPPREVFQSILQEAGRRQVDAALLTGDIIHFPSFAGIETIERAMADLGVPFLYTPGNHDWYFPHLGWTEATRREYYPRFHGLTGGNPASQALDLGGVCLVALDNSNYQVSSEQVAFLRRQLEKGKPTLLFVHIPLAEESLFPGVMEKWKAPIMMGAEEDWTPESRQKWMVDGNEPATLECMELLQGKLGSHLGGIFCGHVHFSHAGAFGENCLQYVTNPGFAGGYRIIELKRHPH